MERKIAYLIALGLIVIQLVMLPRLAVATEITNPPGTVPREVRFSGVLQDAAGATVTGVQGVTFALYAEQAGGAPLWRETQNVSADAEGRYAVLLGSMRADGLPQEVFTSNEARWLGVQVNQPGSVEQARVLLVSVPYALKAADAETLGGRPVSAFVLAPSADKSSTTTAAASDALPTAAVTVSGSGTNNQITKWLDGAAGTLTDSVMAESGGNIGIGTAAPAFKLDVASAVGNGSQSYIRINDTTADVTGDIYGGADATLIFGAQRTGFSEGAGGILDVTTNNPIFLKTNDQTRMTILGGGNVGIGTAAPTQKRTG